MRGYVAKKGDPWYAVVYEGIDPVTGREPIAVLRCLPHPPLAAGKQLVLAASTYAGYRHNVERHIVPALRRIALRRLRPHHLEAFYSTRCGSATTAWDSRRRPCTGSSRHPRRADRRGTTGPRDPQCRPRRPRATLRAIPKVEQRSWTAEELQAFLRAAAGHRLFAALWTAAFTGMRRNELLGLCRDDLDAAKARCRRPRALR